MEFKAKSVFILRKAAGGKFWKVLLGNNKVAIVVDCLYRAWLCCHKAMVDKDRITEIRIEVYREK